MIWGGLRDCGQGPEIVLADAAFHNLVATAFEGSDLIMRGLGMEASAPGFDRAMSCR